MTDLPGGPRDAVAQPAVRDDPAADAGADEDADEVPLPTSGSELPLPEGRGADVVHEDGGKSSGLGELGAQRHVTPREIRGRDEHAVPFAELPGDSGSERPRPTRGVAEAGLDAVGDHLHDLVGRVRGLGRVPVGGEDRAGF